MIKWSKYPETKPHKNGKYLVRNNKFFWQPLIADYQVSSNTFLYYCGSNNPIPYLPILIDEYCSLEGEE